MRVVIACLICLMVVPVALGAVGASPNPKPVSQPYVDQIQATLDKMVARWTFLDSRCDPLSVFSLTYIYMTRSLRETVRGGYFDDGELMSNFTIHFASRYADAIDNYLYNTYNFGGQPANQNGITAPWADTFDYAASNKSSAMEDLVLGMNTHINYDLSRIVYDLDYARGNALTGYPYKNDYDRINDILNAMVDPISTDLAGRYDETLGSPLVGILDPAILQMLISWRTNAWYNGLMMSQAQGPLALQTVQANTQAQTLMVATTQKSYHAPTFTPTSGTRQGWCATHHNTNIDYSA